ncbi:MAG: HAMP domain-containing sensor histidine kinase [Acidimicrobiales bacterium]
MSPERHGRALSTRLGLRARVTALFGLGALLVSVTVGMSTYLSTRHFLVDERTTASLRQAYHNARTVRQELPVKTFTPGGILSTADSGTSYSVLNVGKAWYGRVLSVGQTALPASLRHLVQSGAAASQTFTLTGQPYFAVGVPIPSVGASYYELFDVGDLTHTLRLLSLVLFGAGLLTTALGTVVGRWASGRSLRPLTGVSRAAVAIASGRLDTRLGTTEDRDLTDLTGSFNRMVDELQERIEREERFTSDVSHELRSPLTTLSASLDVLEGHATELGPSGRAALVLLAADLRRFQRMVGDLLEISRSDTGSADVVLEEVDPGELVRRAVAASSRAAAAPAPEVHVAPEVDGLRMSVDKRRFERVVGNLLENAALYGGGATRVETQAVGDPDRPRVQMTVDDDGPGITPTERERIFERFYRGQASGRRGAGTGTGLGLSLVAEHVRLLGGTARADESPSGGARFVVELPAHPVTDLDDQPEEELAVAGGEASIRTVDPDAIGAAGRSTGGGDRRGGVAREIEA